MTASARQIWIDSQQVACGVTYTDATTGYTAVLDVLAPLRWGSVSSEIFELHPGIGDGMLFLGSKGGPRDFGLTLRAKSSASIPAAYLEAFKDFMHGAMLKWFKPGGRLVTLKVVRNILTAAATQTTAERVLYVKAAEYASWEIDQYILDQYHEHPETVVNVPLHAPYGWWIDSTTSGKYVTGTTTFTTTPGNVNVTNDGDKICGIQIAFQGPATVTAVTFSITIGAGLGGVSCTTTLAAGSWTVFDFKCADPQKCFFVSGIGTSDLLNSTILDAATSVRGGITAWPSKPMTADMGTVTVSATATGAGTATLLVNMRRQWGDC